MQAAPSPSHGRCLHPPSWGPREEGSVSVSLGFGPKKPKQAKGDWNWVPQLPCPASTELGQVAGAKRGEGSTALGKQGRKWWAGGGEA